MDFLALANQCASFVSPYTLEAIIKTESNYDPFKIGVNGGSNLERQPVNIEEAVVTAQWLLKNGYNIDLGLAQVNSSNLNRIGLSVTDAFDSCKNIKAAGSVFNKNYQVAIHKYPEDQALQVALSAYNTGNFIQRLQNGYVQKVLKNMPNKTQFQPQNQLLTVKPIPLINSTHRQEPTDIISQNTAETKLATVTIEKTTEAASVTPTSFVYQAYSNDTNTPIDYKNVVPDKNTRSPEQLINVYTKRNMKSLMVYQQ